MGSKDGSELQMLRRRPALLERLQGEKALASELGALAGRCRRRLELPRSAAGWKLEDVGSMVIYIDLY